MVKLFTQLKQFVASEVMEDPPLTVFKQPRFIYVRGHSILRKPRYQGGKFEFDDGFATFGGVAAHTGDLGTQPTAGNTGATLEAFDIHYGPEARGAVGVSLGHVALEQGLPACIGALGDGVFRFRLEAGAGAEQ